jgi:Queuosine biosynthesis protein QueC
MKRRSHLIVCNGADPTSAPAEHRQEAHTVVLAYDSFDAEKANIEIGLPRFVSSLYHLPARVLDLLEIAAYVFCTDRSLNRGAKDLVEYDAWGRIIHYVIRVRDHAFWSNAKVSNILGNAITWATGDHSHTFTFAPGHSTLATGLFDSAEFRVESAPDTKIALFSGGIDSLTGAMSHLQQERGPLCLVSHRSSTDVQNTQRLLLQALYSRYPGRIRHYPFACRLKGKRAQEETQRSRSFLFCSIAYALAAAHRQDRFYIYENGITSLNLPKREGMGLARASRTTHPRTIRLFEQILTMVNDSEFTIETPFFWKTKTDVLRTLKENNGADLLDTSVSCTRTYENADQKTHCGGCSQCVDRRFAAVAAGLSEQDHAGLYTNDFVNDTIEDPETRTFVIDFLAQAKDFATSSADRFEHNYLAELAAIEDYIRGVAKGERVAAIHDLCRRHGQQTMQAARMLNDPTRDIQKGTLLSMLSLREYLKTPISRLVDEICNRLLRAIPITFKSHKPTNENDFNDKVDGLLNGWRKEFDREHPCASFARAKMIPDHLNLDRDILLESKYIRGRTTPSKATDGLAADMFKLPPELFKLLVVYDPTRAIADDDEFRADFESRGNCRVLVVR